MHAEMRDIVHRNAVSRRHLERQVPLKRVPFAPCGFTWIARRDIAAAFWSISASMSGTELPRRGPHIRGHRWCRIIWSPARTSHGRFESESGPIGSRGDIALERVSRQRRRRCRASRRASDPGCRNRDARDGKAVIATAFFGQCRLVQCSPGRNMRMKHAIVADYVPQTHAHRSRLACARRQISQRPVVQQIAHAERSDLAVDIDGRPIARPRVRSPRR